MNSATQLEHKVLHIKSHRSRATLDMRSLNDRLVISSRNELLLLQLSAISHCTALSNYCRICCRDGRTILVSRTLKQVKAALPQEQFIRVHQSHLVRLDMIEMIRQNEVILECGSRVPVSRKMRADLRERILHEAICI